MNHHVLDVEKKRFGVSISLRFFLFLCKETQHHQSITKKRPARKKNGIMSASQLRQRRQGGGAGTPRRQPRKGGHTCWVLVAGEGPNEDLAKGSTKTPAPGVLQRRHQAASAETCATRREVMATAALARETSTRVVGGRGSRLSGPRPATVRRRREAPEPRRRAMAGQGRRTGAWEARVKQKC